MRIAPGTKLGPYEIVAPLGAGGMGEVWRAHDPRLHRDVAIKVLPAGVAADPERLARFEREAHVLASLNHPNIASLYGLEDAGGVPALVMELIEGPTLTERLASGARSIDEALAIARTIAEAVEYAHEHGVVHRDLKPGNVKLTAEGAVKVLDFGLAKAFAGEEPGGSLSPLTQSPTAAVGTVAGVLLGTAAYMAPEQARGKAVDRRADIWAFGALLFELLSGRQLFAGETVSDTIAAILEREPDWSALPARTPERVRELLRRCLEKDARKRLRDIGDARLELEAAIAAGGSAAAPEGPRGAGANRARVLGVAAITAVAAFAAAWWAHGAYTPGAREVLKVSVPAPSGIEIRVALFTPDGRAMVAGGRPLAGAAGVRRGLYRRALDRFEWALIPGTEEYDSYTLTANDSWVYFTGASAPGSNEQVLRRVPLDGSAPPVELAPWKSDWTQWEMLADGRIGVIDMPHRKYAILERGGAAPSEWKPFRVEGDLNDFELTQPLPGGSWCLGTVWHYTSTGFVADVVAFDFATGAIAALQTNAGSPQYLDSGFLLMSRGASLLAAPFDVKARRLREPPVAVFKGIHIANDWEHGRFRVSSRGDLAFLPGGENAQRRRLATLGADGRPEAWSEERGAFEYPPAIAPDGSWAAVMTVRPGRSLYQIVRIDHGRTGVRRLADYEDEDSFDPAISRDGRWLAFARHGVDSMSGVWVAPIDGSAPARRLLRATDAAHRDSPSDWTPDGRSLLLTRMDGRRMSIRRIRVDEPGARPDVVLDEVFDVANPAVSPDGRWMAYLASEGGERRTCVTTYRADGPSSSGVPVAPTVMITKPWWTRDGRSLCVVATDGSVSAHSIGPGPTVGPGKLLARLDGVMSGGDVRSLPDGRLLFVQRAEGEGAARQLDLVFGFDHEIRKAIALAHSPARR